MTGPGSEQPKLRILSAGAPKTGVRLCAEAYSQATGRLFAIEFATAPAIRDRIAAGTDPADVVVAPGHVIQDFMGDGAVVDGSAVALGSVSTCVAVRNGARAPDISSVEAFRNALLAADTLVFNTASSGEHISKVIAQLGLTDALADRILRRDTGAGVLEYLARDGSGLALGFGQITEIRLQADLGLHLVGPLPGALGNETDYDAGRLRMAKDASGADGLLAFFATEAGRRILVNAGLVLKNGV